MRIVLVGGAYSDNLGDAVIADCLTRALLRRMPGAEIVPLDIAGRLGAGLSHFPQKRLVHRCLGASPEQVRRMVVLVGGSVMLRLRIEPRWRSILRDDDLVVIGGGHLLQDGDLNFPLKVRGVIRLVRRSGSPWAVYSVGVSGRWSGLGRSFFRPVFEEPGPLYCSVRDPDSKGHLLGHFPALPAEEIRVDPDPALLAETVYGPAVEPAQREFDIGICVAHPDVLRFGSAGDFQTAPTLLTDKWVRYIRELEQRGFKTALFTNGSREDDEYLQALAVRLGGQGRTTLLPRAIRPSDLASTIGRMRALIAARLHAGIIAYALNIPCLGLAWDRKLDSFYAMCRRSEWLLSFTRETVETLADRTGRLLQEPLDPAVRAQILGQCQAGVDRLADHLQRHCRASTHLSHERQPS